ncbi:serine carboxypeptidase-like 40 [Euphorbia lathyris]|uniref:serine carboxypeptidase-like 40 n=1 Tax=Euphorbia lathyris TaxID=212925 RepID=UPI0033137718
MEKKGYFVIFLVVILIGENEAKRQGDAIDKLYRAEYLRLSHIIKEQSSPQLDLDLKKLVASRGFPAPLQNNEKEELNLKQRDLIKILPGQPFVKFSQYGGYITVDQIAGRAFYYYFAESHTPLTSPLFLWLNGGPGCSSLGYGAMHEIGPFRVLSDTNTLYLNKFSWNNVANVLFVESPAKVGYSYSNRTLDYSTYGDGLTAADNYMFVVKWLERFPEYKDRDLYIGGESYSGHYVPQLANLILQHNIEFPNFPTINLKGIIIGNPALNLETDVEGMFDYFAGHGLCSLENIQDVKHNCKFTAERNDSLPCLNAIFKTYINVNDIDIYSIFSPVCNSLSQAASSNNKIASVEVIDPCSIYYVYVYLNKVEVQAAMHANTTNLDHPWAPCSDEVIDQWKEKPNSVLPLLKQFMDKGLKVWLFSGDQDAKIPFLATQYSIKTLNLTTKAEWYAWFSNGEVGGYAEEYTGNLTFATVRGAGHEVPYYQPGRALTIFQSFISGTSLPQKVPDAPPPN